MNPEIIFTENKKIKEYDSLPFLNSSESYMGFLNTLIDAVKYTNNKFEELAKERERIENMKSEINMLYEIDISPQEAKELILAHFKKHKGNPIYPSDILEEYHIPYGLILDIFEELEKDGTIGDID